MIRSLQDEDFCIDLDNHADRLKEHTLERAAMARPVATYAQAANAVLNQALQDADEGVAPASIRYRALALVEEFALFPDERVEIVSEAMDAVSRRAA